MLSWKWQLRVTGKSRRRLRRGELDLQQIKSKHSVIDIDLEKERAQLH